jgi:hypothetical protein
VKRVTNLPTLSVLAIFIISTAVSAAAQSREKFVISAKAGGINAVTGRASVHAKGESDWQQLTVTDDLDTGDRVRTDFDGRVEILLSPGSYLRVGGNSEVELADNSLENLEVRLISGTAIVEATGVEQTQMLINISTPHTKLAIDRGGLYRLNVIPNDGTELIVRKGRVILSDTHTKVKGGNKVVFAATSISVAKLSDREKDLEKTMPIEGWSKSRAETIAKANSRISGRMMSSAFSAMSDSDLLFAGSFRRSGLWFYNSNANCYTYLPYGYSSSPYGYGYSRTVYGGAYSGYYPQQPGGNAAGNYPGGNNNPGTSGGNYPSGSAGGGASTPTRTTPLMTAPTMSAPMAAPRDPDSGQRVRPDRP